ncbi:RICIN domain-containing protein [Streptomyces sp. NPDC098789]|uniref:RICIN domain-containing protein n=1 Tax=Streptomyces sp. NPDC098789 TaxID=3366098 RepID=UPI00380BDC09
MHIHNKLAGAAAVMGASVLLVAGTATSANAAEIKQYRNAQTGLCLDSDAKGNVYTKGCGADNPYQQWERKVVDGQIMLRNVATRRCLSQETGSLTNPSPPYTSRVATRTCIGWELDRWWELTVDGKTRLINVNADNALDSNAKGNAYLKNYTADNSYQQWYS